MPEDHAAQLDAVMNSVYKENPTWWPHGLHRKMLDAGAWLVQKAGKPAGFVGLQIRQRPEGRVGYYSVGVLPEFRGQGLAKTALQRMLAESRDRIDSVRAMIVPGNTPSTRLANSLNIPVEGLTKDAVAPSVLKLIKKFAPAALVGGTYTGITGDLNTYADGDPWTRQRVSDALSNVALGAVGGGAMKGGHFGKGLTLALTAPYLKGAAGRVPKMMSSATDRLDAGTKALGAPTGTSGIAPETLAKWLGGGLLLGGGAFGLKKILDEMSARRQLEESRSGGKVRVTLPTKNPGDGETQIEMPVASAPISNSLQGGLNRDVLRRLRREVASRTYSHGRSPENAEAVFA